MRTIEISEAETAYNKAVKEIRFDRLCAALLDRLAASDLVGKTVNRSISDKIKSMMPDEMNGYYTDNYQNRIYFNVNPKGNYQYQHWLTLVNDKAASRRLDGEKLKEEAERLRASARKRETLLESFWDNLNQFNNLVPYLGKLAGDLRTIMPDSYSFKSY